MWLIVPVTKHSQQLVRSELSTEVVLRKAFGERLPNRLKAKEEAHNSEQSFSSKCPYRTAYTASVMLSDGKSLISEFPVL